MDSHFPAYIREYKTNTSRISNQITKVFFFFFFVKDVKEYVKNHLMSSPYYWKKWKLKIYIISSRSHR